MKELIISKWDGQEGAVRFVGYNRDHTACFVRDQTNAIRTIAFRLPNLYGLRYYSNPIGSDGSPVVSIRPALLHLPACFESKTHKEAYEDPESAQGRLARADVHEHWKVATPHKCWLEPEDDGKLEELSKLELNRQRLAYEAALKEVTEEIGSLEPKDRVGAERLRKELEGRFTVVMSDGIGGFKTASALEVPLDFVRHGWAGIRDRFLAEEWAKLVRLDLGAIGEDAHAFHTWLERSAYNARQTTTYLNTRSVEMGVGLRLAPWQWEVLEATTRYEVGFANGTRCWVANIEERPLSSPEEVDDCERLERPQAYPESPLWHSGGFSTIRQHNDKGEILSILPLSNEFRALCQLLAERSDGIAQFAEIEPQIGTRTHELDIAAQVANPSPKGERRVRDLLRTETGKRLLEWGVLTELKEGREKFLKLQAPNILQ